MCQVSDEFDLMVAEADAQLEVDYHAAFPHGECNACGCALEDDGTCPDCIGREVALARFGAECERLGVIPEPEEVALAFG